MVNHRSSSASSATPTGVPAPATPPHRAVHPGDSLGRWRILEVLGRGGMGIVYRAELRAEPRPEERAEARDGPEAGSGFVALKCIHPHLLERPEFLRRFHLEAEAGARVRHVNVVRTFGVETAEVGDRSLHFLVMECVRGRTLSDLQHEMGRVPEGLLRDVAIQIAAGLAAIHESGIIHRDLKPENVLLTERHEVKVMDLGVARLRTEEMRLSRTGQFVGSLLYAAPEQLSDRGQQTGPAVDLYALGLILYTLAAGRHPFSCETVGEVVNAHLNERPAPLSEHAPEASPFLEAVVATLLEKEPDARFASTRALLETLEAGEASPWWRGRSPRAAAGGAGAPDAVSRPSHESQVEGRSKELGELTEAWRGARGGTGSTVLLVGEEGLGKSRLLAAFLDSAREAEGDAIVVPCEAPGGAPFQAFCRALAAATAGHRVEDLFPSRPGAAAAAAALFASADATAAAPSEDAAGLLAEIALALAAIRPRVLAFEDLDRASDASRALFRAIAGGAPTSSLLLLATARPRPDDPWTEDVLAIAGSREIALKPLPTIAMAAILVDLVGSPSTAQAIAPEVLARAGGNPHFLEALVDAWKASGALEEASKGEWRLAEGRLPGEVPASLSDLVARRARSLAPATREALEAACVQGREFDVRVAAAALGRPLLAVLEAMVPLSRESRFVAGEGRVRRFDPPLVQEAVWHAMDPERRTELHRRTAEALIAAESAGDLPRSGAAARIACQFLLGQAPERAAPLLVEALDGLKALARCAEALDLSSLALAAGSRLDARVRGEVLVRRARLLELLGRREEERVCLESALASVEGAGLTPPLAWLDAYGRALASAGNPRAEEVFTRHATAAEEAKDRAAESTAHANLAWLSLRRGELEAARGHAERSLLLARGAGHSEQELRADGLLAAVFERTGRADLSSVHQGRRLAAATRRNDRREASDAHGGLARLALRRGRWREAQVHLDRQWSAARDIGYRRGECRARQGFGRLAFAKGRLAAAVEALTDAHRMAKGLENPADEAWVALDLARAALCLGDRAKALSYALRATDLGRRSGGAELHGYALVVSGAAAEEGGDGEEAAAWYREAIAVSRKAPDGRGDVLALLGLARAARLMGRPDRMADPLERAVSIAERRGWPGPLVSARALAAVGPLGMSGSVSGGASSAAPAAPAPAVVEAVASLARCSESLAWIERIEAHVLLLEATRDAWHLAEAERGLEEAEEDLGPAVRSALRRGWSLGRRVVEARAATPERGEGAA